ncbi:MAG: hypothetical protein ACJAT6_001103, partial [Akkermansiaceae bacterium]
FHDYLGEGGEAVAALDKAIKKDERELESEIMIDQVVCLMDLNQKEEALKLGKKVKLDLLERLDRKKIITDLLEEKE